MCLSHPLSPQPRHVTWLGWQSIEAVVVSNRKAYTQTKKMSSQMVRNVNHLVRKWHIGHLGNLTTLGDRQVSVWAPLAIYMALGELVALYTKSS